MAQNTSVHMLSGESCPACTSPSQQTIFILDCQERVKLTRVPGWILARGTFAHIFTGTVHAIAVVKRVSSAASWRC